MASVGSVNGISYFRLSLNRITLEEFRTSIFEKTKEKTFKRLLFNLGILVAIVGVWVIYLFVLPISIKFPVIVSIALISFKLYEDKYMGISAYGERKAELVIAAEYLEIRDVRIPYTDLTDLVIYVEEYLGMPKETFGIHHGGNNLIEFNRKGKSVSINYVIKNKQDYQQVSQLVDRIEKNPAFKKNLRKLD